MNNRGRSPVTIKRCRLRIREAESSLPGVRVDELGLHEPDLPVRIAGDDGENWKVLTGAIERDDKLTLEVHMTNGRTVRVPVEEMKWGAIPPGW
jgi:hypothetical protein